MIDYKKTATIIFAYNRPSHLKSFSKFRGLWVKKIFHFSRWS